VLAENFPDAVIGYSDHCLGNAVSLAAVAVGACILEKHFTSDKRWPGPDVALSMDPPELKALIADSLAVYQARGGTKDILPEEQPTIDFAYASVVTIRPVRAGDRLSMENLWVKRPGTGALLARELPNVLGRTATRDLLADAQLQPGDYE